MIRYLHINWVANQVFNTSNSNVLGSHVHARANKQTDQTTTLCVQEVEIYLERWEVLGALVDVSVGKEV